MRKTLAVLAAATVVIGSVATVSWASASVLPDASNSSTAAAASARELAWQSCPPAPQGALDPRQECATLDVPLDYQSPAGQQISLTVSRIPAATPARRRGVLVLLPNIGAGSLNDPSKLSARLPADVRASYDIVGFDPRGTGHSTPISCGLQQADTLMPLPWPGPGGDITANTDRARRIADACAANAGPLVSQISARNEARDLDRIRIALNEQKLSYWGVLYGGYVGAVYATMFPQRTDRVVLDSNIDPRLVERGLAAGIGPGVAARFPDFAAWAAARNDTYGLGATPTAVRDLFLRQATDLERTPRADLPTQVYHASMFAALQADRNFPLLAQVMQAVKTSGPLPALPFPTPGPALENQVSVLNATSCDDIAWPRTVDSYTRAVAADRTAFPLTAGMPVNIRACAFWSTAPAEPAVRITPHGPTNVLLIQNLRDPAAPYTAALATRAAFGNRARLITVDAGGSGAYLADGNTCGDTAVTAFLTAGTRPAHDITCPA